MGYEAAEMEENRWTYMRLALLRSGLAAESAAVAVRARQAGR